MGIEERLMETLLCADSYDVLPSVMEIGPRLYSDLVKALGEKVIFYDIETPKYKFRCVGLSVGKKLVYIKKGDSNG